MGDQRILGVQRVRKHPQLPMIECTLYYKRSFFGLSLTRLPLSGKNDPYPYMCGIQ